MKNISGKNWQRSQRNMTRQTFKGLSFSLILDNFYLTSEKKNLKENWQHESDRWQRCRENLEKKKKQKTNSSCRVLYLCKMWSLATWRPRWNVVCLWLEGNSLNLNFNTSFVRWYCAITWHNLVTILTVCFGKLTKRRNSTTSCFPVFSIARALRYTTLPLFSLKKKERKKTPSSSPAAVKPKKKT